MAQPGDGGKYWAAHPAIARIPRHDAEPVAGTLARLAVVSLANRKRADDPKPRDAGENIRGAERRPQPLLHPGVGWRSPTARSIPSGAAPVPPATVLGSVAVDPGMAQ